MKKPNPTQGTQDTGDTVPAQPTARNVPATPTEPDSFMKKAALSAGSSRVAGPPRP